MSYSPRKKNDCVKVEYLLEGALCHPAPQLTTASPTLQPPAAKQMGFIWSPVVLSAGLNRVLSPHNNLLWRVSVISEKPFPVSSSPGELLLVRSYSRRTRGPILELSWLITRSAVGRRTGREGVTPPSTTYIVCI